MKQHLKACKENSQGLDSPTEIWVLLLEAMQIMYTAMTGRTH